MRLAGALTVLAVTLWSTAALRDGFDHWVSTTQLPPLLSEVSVEVRDSKGALLRAFPVENGRVRLGAQLDQVDPAFVDMLIRYEDKRFYRHHGVDPIAALRAGLQAMRAGKVISGGSTLTMQAARLLENSGTGQVKGKLRQMRVALALERFLTKREILELYLAHAPYGGPVEGLRAGTLAWFGKEPQRLTAAEAALMIALPQAPEARRPDRFPRAAFVARERVLVRTGHAEKVLAQASLPARMKRLPRLAAHLADRARGAAPSVQRHDLTLDGDLQRAMEALAARAVAGKPRGVSVALVVAEHGTGAVRASVGSAAYSAARGAAGFVDMTTALRSPGSTLKPFVYGLAFDEGLAHPDTLIEDVPVAFGRYAPQNFDGRYRGTVTMREALQASLNIPPVLLTQELGPARLMAALRSGGAAPVVPGGEAGLAVALGGVGLTLKDLVQLYGGLANAGRVQPLYWDKSAAPASAPGPRLLSPAAAWQVGHILAGIPPPGGFAARAYGIAYKTGTSYGHRDAWAIGYDGSHVIGVWLGRPDGTPVPGAFGGALAAPLLFEAFARLKPAPDPLPPPPPETLILSTASLPAPLRFFRGRDAAFLPAPDAPSLRFPPSGAKLQRMAAGIPLKFTSGKPPFTVIVDGAPVLSQLRAREVMLPLSGPGFAHISVVDALGRSSSVQIEMR